MGDMFLSQEKDRETPYVTRDGASLTHVLLTSSTCPCRHRPDEEARDTGRPTRCLVCDGGLAICALCGAAEIELDKPCTDPGGRQ